MENRNAAEIVSTYWEKIPALEMRAADKRALVLPWMGGHLVSLEDSRGPRLRRPENLAEYLVLPEAYGLPVLFPPNRFEGNRFSAGGRDYTLPPNRPNNLQIHGFLFERPWQVERLSTKKDEAELELTFQAGEEGELFSRFPHPFSARQVFRLNGDGLFQEIFFENRGNTPMPFMLGYHTAFALPGRDKDPECFRITVPIGQELKGDQLVETGAEMAAFRQGRILKKGEAVWGQFLAEAGPGGASEVLIENLKTGARLRYRIDRAYAYLLIWNQNGRDSFICIEPQTCAINAPNLHGEMVPFGFRMLAPGELFRASTGILLN